MKDLSETYVTY